MSPRGHNGGGLCSKQHEEKTQNRDYYTRAAVVGISIVVVLP